MTAETIRREVEQLTSDLIEAGLCIDQNFPALRQEANNSTSLTFSGLADLSYTLKNVPYRETYQRIIEARSYNLKLIDGGAVQLLYKFQADEIVSHRLAFFPSPDLLVYQNDSDIYDDDSIYGDVTSRNIVTVPLRFDFDPIAFVEIHHPKSHLTIGQYKNCRIVVSGPLSPNTFVRFLLQSFYNTPYRNFCGDLSTAAELFPDTITAAELQSFHMHLGHRQQT